MEKAEFVVFDKRRNKMVKVNVSKGFTITLPIEVAKELNIREGESFLVDVSSKNTIVLIRLLTERERLADEAFGMWGKRRDISDSVEYVNKMRDEWSKRTELIDA